MIQLADTPSGHYLVVNLETGEDILVLHDWDFPFLATIFGWEGLCRCGWSDGTVDCECAPVETHIEAADQYLQLHIGEVADDPGYFMVDLRQEYAQQKLNKLYGIGGAT